MLGWERHKFFFSPKVLIDLGASFANRERSNVVSNVVFLRRILLTLVLDRVHPSCGWCARNGQICEYKERKKPGLRAGYGKELEQRLGQIFAFLTSKNYKFTTN